MSLLPIGMRQYDREGVTSISTHNIAVAHRLPHEISYHLEHLIPNGMTEAIIDDPEEIQV
jgi:ABC-type phosphonate transport system ATPase subunit